jgi:hypothetical protein
MTQLKHHAQITTLILALVFTNTVLAADPFTDENKNNSTSNTISDVNNAGHTDGDFSFSVERNVNTSSCYQQRFNHVDAYRQMQRCRQQQQAAQLKSYNRFLDNRKQQIESLNQLSANNYLQADLEAGYKTYIQNREERREAATEKRKTMQLKMYQTNTTSARVEKI